LLEFPQKARLTLGKATKRATLTVPLVIRHALISGSVPTASVREDGAFGLPGIMLLELDAFGRIVACSPTWLGVLGVDAEAILEQPFFSISLEEDRPTVIAAYETLLNAGVAAGFGFRTRLASQECLRIYMSGRRLENGHLLLYATDWGIDEEPDLDYAEEAERLIAERTSELRAANEELEAFCFSVAHDLRQPLRAIDGFSRAVIEDFGAQLGDEGRDMLGRVRGASKRLDETIDALLALSRVTREPLRREWVDLSAIADDVLVNLVGGSPARRATVTIERSMRAYGDPRMLRLLVANLLENAWKFTSETDEGAIHFGTEHEEGRLLFVVRDNGAGFDMRYSHKLFLPFERLHKGNQFPGHGIGLATCRRVVARHGGQITLVGNPGLGATAVFTLSDGPAAS
jgi:signal transduction histidine kinase